MYVFISILSIFITIFFVVGTHEAAHFLMARSLGVKVLRFSIGFGKVLLRKVDKSGTEYVFALIPLGGYVKMLDENDTNVRIEDQPYAYNRQPFHKKFLIVIAGPLCNLLCALLLYWLIFMLGFTTVKPVIGQINKTSIAAESRLVPQQEIIAIDHHPVHSWASVIMYLVVHAGNQDNLALETKDLRTQQTSLHSLDLSNWHMNDLSPDPLLSLGIVPFTPDVPLVIGIIQADSPAANSQLRLGDKIIALNKKPVKTWESLLTTILASKDQSLLFTIERQQQTVNIPVQIGHKKHFFADTTGYLGISPNFTWPKMYLNHIQYPPYQAFIRAAQEVKDFSYFNLVLFGKLITGKLSLQSLGGPITIFESAGDALNYGMLPFLGFLAFLSIAIGIINLFPIPGLDGGHLLIQIIEFIIRRPLPLPIVSALYYAGFLFIIFILLQSLSNDLLRL